jgi:hypothetical protein
VVDLAVVAEDVAKERVGDALEALEDGVWRRLEEDLADSGYVAGRRRLLRYLTRPERLSQAEEASRHALRALQGLEPVTFEERLERLEAADWRFTGVPRLARASARALLL